MSNYEGQGQTKYIFKVTYLKTDIVCAILGIIHE